ncbi:hypothetical protein N7457_001292 [Penicillium paradoxum]|uniref:uncharacterized protein n=1 Tax=Penicillium paradoxum TaxID=176176 RepID=UPI002547E04F|nr:uncharacterized protein N7457_001292 [Penicillium paradoxum]KAJ5794693.1 hypothetical protein N7457_001292 [Penicillium paradoxum]
MELKVYADNTGSGKWTVYSRATAVELGACSVVAVYNQHGFLMSNISPDGNREAPAAARLCQEYSRVKESLFCNEPVMLWILYEQENPEKGGSIRAAMQSVRAVQAFEQVYSGESFMAKTKDAGAQFSLTFSAGVVRATMHRQDGMGSAIPLSGGRSIVLCT